MIKFDVMKDLIGSFQVIS